MLPSVSIIIPIKNEENNIRNCLSNIFNQTYDKNKLEVLIVDGNSVDNSRKIINELVIQNNWNNVLIIDDHGCQRSSGLNEGIKYAKGDLILRIDARTIIPINYIEKCVQTILETGADNVGGIQKPVNDHSINNTQRAIGYAMAHPFGVGNAQFRLGKKSGLVDSVYLGCFARNIFNQVGLFDAESPIISEDSDINYRIRKNGGKVYLNKDILAYYVPRETLRDLAKLYFRYGGARAGFLLKWKTYTGYRQLVPPLVLLILLGLPLFFILNPLIFYVWLTLVLSYVFCDLFATVDVIKKTGKTNLIWRLMAIFPVMHFSWALGFWKRMLQGKNPRYWGY